VSRREFVHFSGLAAGLASTAGPSLSAADKPAVKAAKGMPGDLLDNVIRGNVERGVERLKKLEPILARPAKKGELKVVGATYDLRSGKIKVYG
jgi:carbonic anhydrase